MRGRQFSAASVIALSLGGAAWADDDAGSAVDEVIVTGTRQQAQTQFTALSPVDVFSAKAIHSTATAQLHEALAELVPSFNVKKLPSSDGPQFIRPASLDGLSPDMTLVMINGKRFHRSAFLNNNTGAQAVDLAQIPNFAVGHIEVLRDGASAQYGSDAIAGVINIILDDKPGFSAYAQGSQYYKGDGAQGQFGGRAGFALPGGGHLAGTVEYAKADATSRTAQRPDAIAFQAANPNLHVPNPVQNWGNPETESWKYAVDAAEPLGDIAEAYAFGTYGQGSGINDINWRNPSTDTSFKVTSVFPGFDLRGIYPTGFSPREGVKYNDGQIVGGIRNQKSEDFTWDLSASYGRNSTSFFLRNSINASLGPASPTSFNLGRQVQEEFNLNADAVYRWHVGFLPQPVNVAFGAERRVETYEVKAGDPTSYAVGPGAATGLPPESNGFPGFSPQQAGSFDQTSYAGYIDVQAPITDKWSVEGAIRDENYDVFGNTFNYKVATRYEVTPQLAVRGSYSTGFKAPTPAQLNSTATSQGLDTNTLQLFTNGRLSPLNPVAQFFGAKPLDPEESKTFTGGLVWRTDFGLTGSVDIYQTDVDKRFSVSKTFVITPAIQAQLVALGVNGGGSFTQVSFFTNDFDTRTRGIDLVASYTRPVGPGQLDLTGAYSYTKTDVTSGSLASAANVSQKVVFEQGIPDHNASGTATYTLGKFQLMGRVRYYGGWTDVSGNATGDLFQKFGGIAFFDAAVTYNVNSNVSVRVGAENLFDTYPDKATNQASRGIVYSRNSPYDTNGGDYYVRVDLRY
jgi:iron complex outermembrane receptor protein